MEYIVGTVYVQFIADHVHILSQVFYSLYPAVVGVTPTQSSTSHTKKDRTLIIQNSIFILLYLLIQPEICQYYTSSL